MRLVCDKCSAIYTIEDGLVADRDFSVACKQCGTPIVVKRTRSPSAAPARPSTLPAVSAAAAAAVSAVAAAPTKAKRPASFEPAGTEAWFVWIDGAQKGPHVAAEIAKLIEAGAMDWATQVWREGFKDWRPARRDAVLVTAVAGVRGVAGDTMRLNAARSFLAPEDTIIDARPQLVAAARGVATTTNPDLLSSTSETKAIDARDMPPDLVKTARRASPSSPGVDASARVATVAAAAAEIPAREEATAVGPVSAVPASRPASVPSGPPGRPNLSPSARPQAWNSPENAAFRAALGLPDSREVVAPKGRSPKSAAAPQPPTLADHFGSAPDLLRTGPVLETTSEMPVSGTPSKPAESWMPKPQSLAAVALAAFAAGVIVAAIAARLVSRPAPAAQRVAAAPALVAQPVAKKQVVSPPPAMPATPQVTRELPDPEELRREVRRVAPEVKRCIENPTIGVDVDIYIDGPSGRVRDATVRAPQITPGRAECVIHGVRGMQVAPFTRAELKLTHKFSW